MLVKNFPNMPDTVWRGEFKCSNHQVTLGPISYFVCHVSLKKTPSTNQLCHQQCQAGWPKIRGVDWVHPSLTWKQPYHPGERLTLSHSVVLNLGRKAYKFNGDRLRWIHVVHFILSLLKCFSWWLQFITPKTKVLKTFGRECFKAFERCIPCSSQLILVSWLFTVHLPSTCWCSWSIVSPR